MQAINHRPDDTTLYSNRSLGWLKMGEGDRALTDAGICRMQRPDWAKACYLQGAANMLLKVRENACFSAILQLAVPNPFPFFFY
jgi:hypothetical protein